MRPTPPGATASGDDPARLPEGPHPLVTLLYVDSDEHGAHSQVLDRAVLAAGLSFTVSDLRQPDEPLVFVNPAFERTTGYSAAEALGRNCRFLQGPATDPADVSRVRDVIEAREHGVVTLLNHRKDGTTFWNELSLSPVHDEQGEVTHVVGIQDDVTPRVHAEQARERHLLAEVRARAAAEQAQQRLALLAEVSTMLAATLDVDAVLRELTRLVVPRLADWCTVELLGVDGGPGRAASSGHAPSPHPVERQQVVATGEPVRLSAEGASTLVLPMSARRRVVGTLSLGSTRWAYDDADLVTGAELARRAALAVDNARLYEREHHVAEQLQRSLLPVLPQVAGLDCAARYLPGQTAAQVGGDWYDVFALPDGDEVGIAIGDVMGHDLTAAAAMGQLRSVLRAYAWQGSAPAQALDSLDRLVQGLSMAQLATAVYGRLELPAAGRPGRLRLANAGHLPPVLRTPDGTTRLLDGAVSLLLGAALGTARTELVADVEPGALLVMCTDGLVERRGLDPDEGLEQLRAAVQAAPDAPAEEVCDALLAALLADGHDDDVALLVVRVR